LLACRTLVGREDKPTGQREVDGHPGESANSDGHGKENWLPKQIERQQRLHKHDVNDSRGAGREQVSNKGDQENRRADEAEIVAAKSSG
jgi:hypothetical protein